MGPVTLLLTVEKSVKVDLPVGSFDWAPYFPGSWEVLSRGRGLRSSCCVSPSYRVLPGPHLQQQY